MSRISISKFLYPFTFLLILSLGLNVPGCSTLKPRTENIHQTTLRSWNEEKIRSIPQARALNFEVWESGKRITVKVFREQICKGRVITFREIQEKVSAEANWPILGPLFGIGGLSFGLGNYLTFSSFSRPKLLDNTSRGELSKEGALLLGATLIVLGSAAGAYGLWALLTEGQKIHPKRVIQDATDESEWDCGHEPEVGVQVKLETFTDKIRVVSTDKNGQAVITPDLEHYVIPPVGIPWAKIETPFSNPQFYTPPASIFYEQMKNPSYHDLAAFKRRFPDSEEWKKLEPLYLKLAKLESTKSKAKQDTESAKQLAVPTVPLEQRIEIAANSALAKALANVQPPPANLFYFFDLNIWKAFDIEKEYNTPGKKKAFATTPTYKKYLAKAQQERAQAQNKLYYLTLDAKIEKYNLQKFSLEITRFKNWGQNPNRAILPKTQGMYLFSNIPSTQAPRFAPIKLSAKHKKNWSGPMQEIIRLKVDVQQAMNIEKHKDELRIFVVFKPKALKEGKLKYFSTKSKKLYMIRKRLLDCQIESFIIADPKTGQIYFNKTEKELQG